MRLCFPSASAETSRPVSYTHLDVYKRQAVSTNGANEFISLSPRQQLTPVPYAEFASSVSGLTIHPNGTSPNVILGYSSNYVAGGVFGAAIGGGGDAVDGINKILDVLGTIGGGGGNTVSGNVGTVAGGGDNTASGQDSTVAGGSDNTASGNWATVAGGSSNTAGGGEGATVTGGEGNTASGIGAFIGGGGIDGLSLIHI